jgi:hypothetical protein
VIQKVDFVKKPPFIEHDLKSKVAVFKSRGESHHKLNFGFAGGGVCVNGLCSFNNKRGGR